MGDFRHPPPRCKWRGIPLEYISFPTTLILSRCESEYMLGAFDY
jgi:hypothetical protein